MKYEVEFPAMPDTTYHIDHSMTDMRTIDEHLFDLARRMHQSEWFYHAEGSILWCHVVCEDATAHFSWTINR